MPPTFKPANPEIDITIDTSEDFETLTLAFMTADKQMSVSFALPEAQLLNMWLTEAINLMLVKKLEIH